MCSNYILKIFLRIDASSLYLYPMFYWVSFDHLLRSDVTLMFHNETKIDNQERIAL